MNDKHTKELFELAPILYSGHKESIRTNLMPFGFECDDGWYQPLRDLSVQVEGANMFLKSEHVKIKAMQVKEKFGTLRFYFDVCFNLPWWKRLIEWVLHVVRIPFYFDATTVQRTLINAAESWMGDMVSHCEDRCFNVCEICGNPIDDKSNYEGSKRVTTKGYIRVLCQRCADKEKYNYEGKADNKTKVPSEKTKAKRRVGRPRKVKTPLAEDCNTPEQK